MGFDHLTNMPACLPVQDALGVQVQACSDANAV